MTDEQEIKEARRWIAANCHHGHPRYMLERGISYLEALVKAGLCPESSDGDDLYRFLSSPDCDAARRRFFMQPGL